MQKTFIRKAISIDLQAVYQLERAYMMEHESEHLERWDAAQERIFQGLLDNLNHMFVSELGGTITGLGYWAMYEGLPCIYSIYVSRRSRRQGIASKLMIAMEQDVRDQRYTTLTLSTLVSNPAQHLFDVLNYEEIRRENEWIYFTKIL